VYEKFWYENLKEREQHEYGTVDLRIILKRIVKKVSEGVDWIHPAQDGDQRPVVLKTVMNPRVP
jgi:hypothetical protein